MRSPIAESGSFGDTIKIKALPRELGNPGWTVIPVRRKLLSMGDLDDIQFQPNLQDIADDTVVPLGADNQANLKNNRVRLTNNSEWSEEQKHRIVEIDHQEKRKGKNFMKFIKRRWDSKFWNQKGWHKTWLTIQGDSRMKDGEIWQSGKSRWQKKLHP